MLKKSSGQRGNKMEKFVNYKESLKLFGLDKKTYESRLWFYLNNAPVAVREKLKEIPRDCERVEFFHRVLMFEDPQQILEDMVCQDLASYDVGEELANETTQFIFAALGRERYNELTDVDSCWVGHQEHAYMVKRVWS